MQACQGSNLTVYLFALGKTDEALEAAFASIRAGADSFVAVPLQHVAALVAPVDARRAARILGYVEAVFEATGFSRQYTEEYTYDALMKTLHAHLSEELLAEYMREGASMSAKHAVLLAGAGNEGSALAVETTRVVYGPRPSVRRGSGS